jgi:hypothetical protein
MNGETKKAKSAEELIRLISEYVSAGEKDDGEKEEKPHGQNDSRA